MLWGDRSRVIASSDCGFGTLAGGEFVAEDVVWAKLKSCWRAPTSLHAGYGAKR